MLKLKKIFYYFSFPVIFYLLHLFLNSVFDIYTKFSWFDKVMHFSGGVVLALTFFPILNYLHKENYAMFNKFVKFVFAISLIISVAVFWEFYEFVMDYFFHVAWQPSVADTIADLFFGMIGGIVIGLIFLWRE